MSEKHIERAVCRAALKRFGVPNVKLTTDGQTGYPDRLFLIPGGRPLFIEFKQPGEKPRAKQKHIHAELRKLGYDVETHDNFEEALKAIEDHTPPWNLGTGVRVRRTTST